MAKSSDSVIVKRCGTRFDKTKAFMEANKRNMAHNYVKNSKLPEGVDPQEREDQVVAEVDSHMDLGEEKLNLLKEEAKKQKLENSEDAEKRKNLSGAANNTRDMVRDVKANVRSSYSYDFLVQMQLGGSTPQDTRGILQHSSYAVAWFTDPDTLFPPPKNLVAEPMNKERIAGLISTVHQNLRKALTEYDGELKETEAVMLHKNRLIDDFNSYMTTISGLFYFMMKLAGMDDEAERLRPNLGRSRS